MSASGIAASAARPFSTAGDCSGSPAWKNEEFNGRRLIGALAAGGLVVTGDLQGFVHWLDRASGALIGRIRTAKGRVTNAPVVADGIVYVQTDAGHLYALRARPRK